VEILGNQPRRRWTIRATLIYNPKSGRVNGTSPQELASALEGSGYEVAYIVAGNEQELDRLLADVEGLLVIAGGDGTVRSVVTRILGRNLPVSILPLGSANNIAKMYGVEGNPLDIIAGLRQPRQEYLDIGAVSAPWGEDYFLETFGIGLWADVLHLYQPEKGKSISRSITAALKALSTFDPVSPRLWLDGQELTGQYMLLEALNTNAFGPRLKAAPSASPSDGKFDLVGVPADQRENLLKYLIATLNDQIDEMPGLEHYRGRELRFDWTGFLMHVDAEVRPPIRPPDPDLLFESEPPPAYANSQLQGQIRVWMLERAVELWLPPPKEDPGYHVHSIPHSDVERRAIEEIIFRNHAIITGTDKFI
jgi:diacylglycerol kinase (ATP)